MPQLSFTQLRFNSSVPQHQQHNQTRCCLPRRPPLISKPPKAGYCSRISRPVPACPRTRTLTLQPTATSRKALQPVAQRAPAEDSSADVLHDLEAAAAALCCIGMLPECAAATIAAAFRILETDAAKHTSTRTDSTSTGSTAPNTAPMPASTTLATIPATVTTASTAVHVVGGSETQSAPDMATTACIGVSIDINTDRKVPVLNGGRVEAVGKALLELGLPIRSLATILAEHPAALLANPVLDWQPKVDHLLSMGLTLKQVGHIFVQYPAALVAIPLQQQQITVTAVRNCGINKTRLPKLLLKGPMMLGRDSQEIYAARRLLKALGAQDNTVITAFMRRPQLLTGESGTVLTLYHRFSAMLSSFGITHAAAAKAISVEPTLLTEDLAYMAAVLRYFKGNGLQAIELEQMVMRHPPILLHDLEDLVLKMRFLKGFIKRPPTAGKHRMEDGAGIWGGIVTFPGYFRADLANYIGPRSAFIRAKQPELLQQRNLATWLVKSDNEFAEIFMGILVEEYLVFKAQWQRTSGPKYGWRPNVRSVVRPGAKVGAEGRVAVV